MRDGRRLESEIEALLAEDSHAGHPLHQALAALYAEYQARLHQIERIARISDRYQSVTREKTMSLTERFNKQLRQLEKISRISDRYQFMMRDLNQSLKQASTTDSLTGIGNRRMLMEKLRAEQSRAERLKRPFAIAIADIDRFKLINDTYGHDTGDKVLLAFVRTIESDLREYDVCGRWGGEEFLIIMPETDVPDAAVVIERLRSSLHQMSVRLGDQGITVSASFGIAEYREGESLASFINRADTALFAAKRAGRDRYEIAS